MKAKTLIASSILAASAVASSVAMAEESAFTGNIGVTSNYMWRGQTLSNDTAAVQGGLDYGWSNGAYVGTWVSEDTSLGIEVDLYGGYAFDWAATSWDVGYIYYAYPLTENNSAIPEYDASFGEVYVNFGWEWLGLGVAYQTNAATDEAGAETSGNTYYFVSGEWEVGSGIGLGAVIGAYKFKNDSPSDYEYGELYLTKSDFTFSLSKTNMDETAWDTKADEPRVWVSWGKAFDL